MTKVVKLTVQKWGNSLAVRIPSAVAKSARLTAGQPVEMVADNSTLIVKPVGEPELSLAQKLALFDPSLHAGEAMPARPLGAEVV